jgi:hypothetical protein
MDAFGSVACPCLTAAQKRLGTTWFCTASMSTSDDMYSQYALPIIHETGHGLRATDVGADFLINTTLAAGNLSHAGIAIGALPPTRASRFVQELRELEEALTKLSQTAAAIGQQASLLYHQVTDATAQREACSAHVSSTTTEAAATPAVQPAHAEDAE